MLTFLIELGALEKICRVKPGLLYFNAHHQTIFCGFSRSSCTAYISRKGVKLPILHLRLFVKPT